MLYMCHNTHTQVKKKTAFQTGPHENDERQQLSPAAQPEKPCCT